MMHSVTKVLITFTFLIFKSLCNNMVFNFSNGQTFHFHCKFYNESINTRDELLRNAYNLIKENINQLHGGKYEPNEKCKPILNIAEDAKNTLLSTFKDEKSFKNNFITLEDIKDETTDEIIGFSVNFSPNNTPNIYIKGDTKTKYEPLINSINLVIKGKIDWTFNDLLNYIKRIEYLGIKEKVFRENSEFLLYLDVYVYDKKERKFVYKSYEIKNEKLNDKISNYCGKIKIILPNYCEVGYIEKNTAEDLKAKKIPIKDVVNYIPNRGNNEDIKEQKPNIKKQRCCNGCCNKCSSKI